MKLTNRTHFFLPATLVIVLVSIHLAPGLAVQSPAQELDDSRLLKLPPQLRTRGQAILDEQNATRRATLVDAFARQNAIPAADFLMLLLDSEPSAAVREKIIDRVGNLALPQVRTGLEKIAASDPDARIALLALDKLRAQQTRGLVHLLERRAALAQQQGSAADMELIAAEQQRWVSLVRGTMLPSFLQIPPPVFAVKAAEQNIHVLAFGDFGNGSPEQKAVAEAALRYHGSTPFDFGITLGDNFYTRGMASPDDPRWRTWWEQLYEPLGIIFYATLGNHDWGFADSPAAEVLYTQRSKSWQMPATYYTFTAGPVQFFALDTNGISEAQRLWLRRQLDQSNARWKVVYGHHPIYSHGQHEDNVNMIDELLPIVRDRADIFLAGHDHDLQHLRPEGRVHFFVAGGGGARIRPIEPGARSLFALSSYGFAVLEADSSKLVVRFIDSNLTQLYEYTLTGNKGQEYK